MSSETKVGRAICWKRRWAFGSPPGPPFLQAALDEHEDKQDFTGQVLMRLWNDERDRVARISEAALRAGVSERAIKLEEKYGETIARLIDHILDDPELGLALSREIKGAVVRRALIAIGDEEPVDGEVLAIES